jgi:hypothetical protein
MASADAGHGEQEREEPELLRCSEAVQGLLVLAHEVIGVKLQSPARLSRGEDRGTGEDAIAESVDLDDERIERDRADGPFDGGDHDRVSRLRVWSSAPWRAPRGPPARNRSCPA